MPGTEKRVNDSLLAGRERRLLNAMAGHVPAWLSPDGMTAIGILGAVLVVAGYAASHHHAGFLWLANLGLLIHWIGDSLDGTLARYRQIERPRLGFYLDQTIDTVGNLFIAIGVGLSPWARMDIALLVLAVYHMLSIQVFVRAIVDREFHMAVGRLGPTEMRLGIFIMNVAVWLLGAPIVDTAFGAGTWCDLLMLATSAVLLALFGYQLHRHLVRLNREEGLASGR